MPASFDEFLTAGRGTGCPQHQFGASGEAGGGAQLQSA
nr:hypothetical protein [Escherichia coli]